MHVIFDVDGCLIDSRELIRRSYHDAGALHPPDDILAYEGIDWLGECGYTPDEVRSTKDLKALYYLKHISNDGVATLPPYAVARRLTAERHRCYAVTGAPHGTIDVLQTRLPDWPFRFAVDGTPTPQRMMWLGIMHIRGVYVDDQSRLIDLPNGWRFVHYVGQNVDELYQQIVRK